MHRAAVGELRLHIPELQCPNEMAVLEDALRASHGVVELTPDYVARELVIRYEPDRTTPEALIEAAGHSGYTIERTEPEGGPGGGAALHFPPTLAAGSGLLLLAILLLLTLGLTSPWVWTALLACVATAGWPLFRAAANSLLRRRIDMNVLMSIAVAGALLTNNIWEGAVVVVLYGFSMWLEDFSLGRAKRAIETLVAVTPRMAHRLSPDDQIEDVSVDQVAVGDRLLVRPGERIAVDGTVLRGRSAVDEAPITGESMPVEKEPGQRVFAGSLNVAGALTIEAASTSADSTLAHIRRLVAQSQSNRSQLESLVDRFAARYTPAVVALAAAIAILGPVAGYLGVPLAAGVTTAEWIYRALILLVVSCPCALVISTPVTVMAGLFRAAGSGIVVKGGRFLEAAARLDTIVFDKTGTLTEGKPRVVGVESFNGHQPDDVLAAAASLESRSEHPLGAAIVEEARRRGLPVAEVEDFEALPGFGVQGTVTGTRLMVGSARMFSENGHKLRDATETDEAETAGTTLAVVGSPEQPWGAIRLADTLKSDARTSVENLQRRGIRVAILSGDGRAAVQRVGRELGVDELYPELLPEDKITHVRRLVDDRRCVAMVGDGINDTPALAAAHIGIALGAAASDTALEIADVAGTSSHVNQVPRLVAIAHRTRAILMQNIALAVGIKGAVLAAAIAGYAGMWLAVLADVGAALVVILNGLRLLRGSEADTAK